MKILRPTKFAHSGSVLLVSLFIACLFGIFLASYLYLVRQQKTLVVRSQAWNSAFALAEGGVEEALAQLNPGAPQPYIDRTANGWGEPSHGLYGPVSRSFSSGSYKVVYSTEKLPPKRLSHSLVPPESILTIQ